MVRRFSQLATILALLASSLAFSPQTPAYAAQIGSCYHQYNPYWPSYSYVVSFKGSTTCTVPMYEMIGDTTVYTSDYRGIVGYGNHFDCFFCLSAMSTGSFTAFQGSSYHLQYRWEGYTPAGVVFGTPIPAGCFNASLTHQICNFWYDFTFYYQTGRAPVRQTSSAGTASSAVH